MLDNNNNNTNNNLVRYGSIFNYSSAYDNDYDMDNLEIQFALAI